jgi:peptidoglycan-associated lipoprotein
MRLHLGAQGSVAILVSLLVTACASSHGPAAGAVSPALRSPTTGAVGAQPAAVPISGTVAISEEIRRACGIADQDAYFAFDSSAILSADITPLDAVARCFTVGPLAGHSLRLVGHADPRGAAEYNMTLGQGRADSVEGYLDRHGVLRSKIDTTSRGAIDATGTEAAAWAHDRRVDVMLGSARGG